MIIKLVKLTRTLMVAVAALAACAALVLARGHASAAVTISSISVGMQGDQVLVSWTTASELNNLGFNVLRGDSAEGPFAALNTTYPMVQAHCPGATTCDNPDYVFVDATVTQNQAYWYMLQSVSLSLVEENHAPALCATSGTALCVLPTPTGTATETDEPPQPAPPTATATTPASQGNILVAQAPTATPSQPPAAAAGETSDEPGQASSQATATLDAQLSRITSTQAAQPPTPAAQSGGGQGGQPDPSGEPEPDESLAVEGAGDPTGTATAVAAADVGGLPTQFTFPTATLAASPTATTPSVGGGALSETAGQGGSSWLAPGALPFGLRLGAALVMILLALVALPVTGYLLWQNLRR